MRTLPCSLALVALVAPVALAQGPTAAEVTAGIQAGVDLLVPDQEIYLPDPPVGTLTPTALAAYQAAEKLRLERIRAWCAGSGEEWPYEGVYRVGGRIPSGYRVGGTAIVCSALLGAPGWTSDTERQASVHRSVNFLLDRLASDPAMGAGPKVGYDVRGWGHTYALTFFLQLLDANAAADPAQEQAVRARVQLLVDALELNETSQGGWSYSSDVRVSPFMTGPTLMALYHAADLGFTVDPAVVTRGLDALELARTPQGTYSYSGAATGSVPFQASSARASAAELALHLGGRSTEAELRTAVLYFLRSWDDLLVRKSQQGTHQGPFGIAPYYFFFGHTYAALAIERLPAAERPRWRAEIARLLWLTRESDGGWNDRVFPRTKGYSTAMALLALNAKSAPPQSTW